MLGYGFVKTSIVLFYRRIFVTSKRTPFDIATKITIAVVFLWTIAFILMVIFACGSEFDANWGSPAAQHVYCNKIGFTSEEGLAGSDLVLDVVLLALPIPVVIQAALDDVEVDQNRAYLTLVVVNIWAESFTTETLTVFLYWSMLESGLALIAACLPTLSYLFTRHSFRSVLQSARSAAAMLPHRSSRKSSQSALSLPDRYLEIDKQVSSSSDVKYVPRAQDLARSEYTMQDLRSSASV
ncbi:MAG: hypothetical protein LQ352_006318 [Teloschistes flavicans]|nr:MAG: hypothetical protein LQ352_006318 [Teloschistes flavicans]